jgi:dimeric dUTPase (all-alpha-NTP-PPase superfamily)
MNLQPLIETQKKLMDRIGYNEPDRFEKTILALLVEVGECANEWRGFKYWSKNQKPNTFEFGTLHSKSPVRNPLLEEYVDGFHFVLQLGIIVDCKVNKAVDEILNATIEVQFNELYYRISYFRKFYSKHGYGCGLYDAYEEIFGMYLGLGEMLGFTWEQIEAAYMEKNKINHERQESGY